MVSRIRQGFEFVQECVDELYRVTWPDWPQLKNATLVVIVFCLLVALTIWIMDTASRFLMDSIMSVFGTA